MAAPNIVNVATITGKTAAGAITTSATSVVSNANASGKVFKINSIIISNIDGVASATADISYNTAAAGAGTNYYLAYLVAVPPASSIVIVGKDNPIYLEENKSLVVDASANGDLHYIISYEEIS